MARDSFELRSYWIIYFVQFQGCFVCVCVLVKYVQTFCFMCSIVVAQIELGCQ